MEDNWPKLLIVKNEETGPSYFHIVNEEALHDLSLHFVVNNLQGYYTDYYLFDTYEEFLSDRMQCPAEEAAVLAKSKTLMFSNLKRDYEKIEIERDLYNKAIQAAENDDGELAYEVLVGYHNLHESVEGSYDFGNNDSFTLIDYSQLDI
jgi:hypothetical protein